MLVYLNTSAILTSLCLILLLYLIYSLDCGLSILLLGECLMATLFVTYGLLGVELAVLTPYIISLNILIIAAVDCSIWVLVLVYTKQTSRNIETSPSLRSLKFHYSANRLLATNRLII